MNQLDRNIADAIENPFDGCEDTYDGIIGYLDQVCISKRSSTRMPNYDFMYTMCRYDLANGDLFVSMPCLLYTSPSPRDLSTSRMPSSA